jgi:hypothetical protein
MSEAKYIQLPIFSFIFYAMVVYPLEKFKCTITYTTTGINMRLIMYINGKEVKF